MNGRYAGGWRSDTAGSVHTGEWGGWWGRTWRSPAARATASPTNNRMRGGWRAATRATRPASTVLADYRMRGSCPATIRATRTTTGTSNNRMCGALRAATCAAPRATRPTFTALAGSTADSRMQVMLTDGVWRSSIVAVETVCTRPAARIAAHTFNIEDLLRRCHHLVDSVPAHVRGVGIAARLDRLYLR